MILNYTFYLWIGIGGFFGACSRFALSHYVFKKASKDVPFSTLFINVLGSFALGWTSHAYSNVFWIWGVQVGFLGAFTTFSTVQLEFLNMIKYKQFTYFKIYPLVYLISNYLLCIVFAYIGTIL